MARIMVDELGDTWNSDWQKQLEDLEAEILLSRHKTQLMNKEQLMEKKRKEDSIRTEDKERLKNAIDAVDARMKMNMKATVELKAKMDFKDTEQLRKALADVVAREKTKKGNGDGATKMPIT